MKFVSQIHFNYDIIINGRYPPIKFLGYIVPERKRPFLPNSTSNQNFNPRNTQCMPVVKILIFPDIDSDLDKKVSFSFGHQL